MTADILIAVRTINACGVSSISASGRNFVCGILVCVIGCGNDRCFSIAANLANGGYRAAFRTSCRNGCCFIFVSGFGNRFGFDNLVANGTGICFFAIFLAGRLFGNNASIACVPGGRYLFGFDNLIASSAGICSFALFLACRLFSNNTAVACVPCGELFVLNANMSAESVLAVVTKSMQTSALLLR